MRILVQRSKESSVEVENKIVGSIDFGIVALVSFTHTDTEKEIDYLIRKLTNLRIFDDENGVMNKSLIDVGGKVLSISQFTLYADSSSGNRPSYKNAMGSENATKLYDLFNEKLAKIVPVAKGIFGADMKLNITNDGPITIMLESN